jgi:hypothetical protein
MRQVLTGDGWNLLTRVKTDPDDITNLARFEQMRTRWSELSFVVLDGDEHLEQK